MYAGVHLRAEGDLARSPDWTAGRACGGPGSRPRNSLLPIAASRGAHTSGGSMATTIPAGVSSNGTTEGRASVGALVRLVPGACFGVARATQNVAFRVIGAG